MEKFLLFATIIILSSSGLKCDVNMTEYYQMPPLYEMDDYDRCMEEFPNIKSTYCYTRTQIKPNESSDLWLYIQSFSSNKKRHFRHDRLNRGICMNWCKPKVTNFDKHTQRAYYVAHFDNDTEISYDPNTIPNALNYKVKYDKIVNICVNYKLKKQYDLMAYSEVEYCITSEDSHLSGVKTIFYYNVWKFAITSFVTVYTNAVDIVLAIIFFILIIIIASSSFHDYKLKIQNLGPKRNSEHYKNPVLGIYSTVVVTFSLTRNWYRLISKSNNPSSNDLRPIQALRFLTMFCVVLGHIVLNVNVLPVYNPQYMEKNFYRIITMILVNGTTIIQTFFVISGYLLSIQFMKLQEMSKFSVKHFLTAIVYRYLRLTPVYLFIILFHGTWLVRFQDGPLWPHLAETERTFCRNNWWANIFYINNIFTVTEPCLQHGWYLAADFQMFVIGVALQLLFWKYPRCKKFVLSLALLISYIIPGVLTYVYRYEGAFMIRPESDRYAHWFDEMYRTIYIPFYTNFGSFICGMIGGMLYKKYKHENVQLAKKPALVMVWYSMIPSAFVLLMSAFIFYEYDFAKPAVWIAFYSATIKNLWGFFAAFLITGMAFGIGWIIKDTMSHPIFRPLGRLTFCAYLIHPAIIRLCAGNLRQPIYASDMTILLQVFAVLGLSYIAALFLCLGIELPISALQRHFAGKDNEDYASTTKHNYQVHPNIEMN